MMVVFNLICRLVGLFANSLSIANQLSTYKMGKTKDPSGLAASDGSENEDSNENS